LHRIDDGQTLGIILPSTIYGPAGNKRAIKKQQEQAVAGDDTPPNKKVRPAISPTKRAALERGASVTTALLESAEMVNERTVADWLLSP
jgi:hypothetical protein